MQSSQIELDSIDRIIQEHRIEKAKFFQRKRDKLFRRTFGFMTISLLCVFSGLFFGKIAAVFGCILFFCSIIPAFLISLAEIFVFCFTLNSKEKEI